jgi:hypothetical protein
MERYTCCLLVCTRNTVGDGDDRALAIPSNSFPLLGLKLITADKARTEAAVILEEELQ